MKLWLDDRREPPDLDWTWCPTSAWAIKLLSKYYCEEISFDFDLGDEDKGRFVSDFIEQQVQAGVMTIPLWAVHSDNGPGRAEIERTMEALERRQQVASRRVRRCLVRPSSRPGPSS